MNTKNKALLSLKELSFKDNKLEIIFKNNKVLKFSKIETQILFKILEEGFTKDFGIRYYLNEIIEKGKDGLDYEKQVYLQKVKLNRNGNITEIEPTNKLTIEQD